MKDYLVRGSIKEIDPRLYELLKIEEERQYRRLILIPSESRVSNIQTAFCSNHDSTSVSGSSFTSQLKAFASARATCMAE